LGSRKRQRQHSTSFMATDDGRDGLSTAKRVRR